MWSVDDAQVAARLDHDDPSPWDLMRSSLVEPDLAALGPAQVTDPAQVYAAFWGETVAERPPTRRRRRWARRRARMG